MSCFQSYWITKELLDTTSVSLSHICMLLGITNMSLINTSLLLDITNASLSNTSTLLGFTNISVSNTSTLLGFTNFYCNQLDGNGDVSFNMISNTNTINFNIGDTTIGYFSPSDGFYVNKGKVLMKLHVLDMINHIIW